MFFGVVSTLESGNEKGLHFFVGITSHSWALIKDTVWGQEFADFNNLEDVQVQRS